MNAWQMAQQIRHALATLTWAGGGAVFGTLGVRVFAGAPTEESIPPGFPWALVNVGRGAADRQHPTLIEQPFTVVTACEVAGDDSGEAALIGGAIASGGLLESANRGALEVAERVHAALASLTGADGAPILVSLASPGTPQALGRGRHIVLYEHEVQALVSVEEFYAPPRIVRSSGGGLAWTAAHVRARFDHVDVVVVEKAGSTPSSSPTDGTIVFTTTSADSWGGPTTGGRTYTLFGRYDARGSAWSRYSVPLTDSWIAL